MRAGHRVRETANGEPCQTLEPVYFTHLRRLRAREKRLAEDAQAPGVAAAPVSLSISTKLMLLRHVERWSPRPASARCMKASQIGSAACPPLSPSAWLSSRPTQTTVNSSGVKPTNHASRRSLVVPVLPAASRLNPEARTRGAGAFAQHAAHHVGDEIGRIGARDAFGRRVLRQRSPSRRADPQQRPQLARSPPLVKMVYADAMSNGVASNTPSAIDGNARGVVPAPMRRQRSATRSKPAASATFTVAALRDIASARRNVISPSYSFS